MICVICQQRDADPDYGRTCPVCPPRVLGRLNAIPGLMVELASLGYVQRDYRGLHGFPAVDEHGNRLPHHDPVANVLPSGPLNGSRSAPRVSGSGDAPVPIRLDPTDLLAPARPASTAVRMAGNWWRIAGGDPDQTGRLSVATELETWARDWATDRHEGWPDPQVPSLCRWLADRIDWACHDHPAVDEFAADVQRIHGGLMAANGHFGAPPKSMTASCPSCDGLYLTQEYPEGWIECANCRRLLNPEEYAEYVRTLIEDAKENAA